MISEGTTLAADWIADWVDEWNWGRGSVCALRHARAPYAIPAPILVLSVWIRLRPATREGASGKPEVLVDTHDWFGMISGGFSIGLQKMYNRWIHMYRYGRN